MLGVMVSGKQMGFVRGEGVGGKNQNGYGLGDLGIRNEDLGVRVSSA